MERLRVVLVNMPRILGHVMRDLVGRQPDMAVVGEVRSLAKLPPAIASLRAEAVILTLSPPGVGRSVCGALRKHHPALTLLGLVPSCDQVIVWPTTAPPQHIEMTASGILVALRGRVGMDLGNGR